VAPASEFGYSSPIIQITAQGWSPQTAIRSAKLVTDAVTRELDHMQEAEGIDRAAFRRRLDPVRGEQLRTSPGQLSRDLYELATAAELTEVELHRCRQAVRRFWIREIVHAGRTRLSDAWHRLGPS
jgi:hypothetical protein